MKFFFLLMPFFFTSVIFAKDELSKKNEVTIGFGSCLDQKLSQPIWAQILNPMPDIYIFMGDNIYSDAKNINKLTKAYAQQFSQSEFKKLNQNSIVLATWDDHDYGRNNAGKENPLKKESREIFLETFKKESSFERITHEGVYDERTFEISNFRLQVILLDTRYNRDHLIIDGPRGKNGKPSYGVQTSPDKTFLGDKQWLWLENKLTEKADLRLIVSSVQLINDSDFGESWGRFPVERQRFFELLSKTKAEGVVILSGDKHKAEFYKLMPNQVNTLKYPLYEFTSSGLNRAKVHEGSPDAIKNILPFAGPIEINHTGLLKLDVKNKTLNVKIILENGNIGIEHKIDLNWLKDK